MFSKKSIPVKMFEESFLPVKKDTFTRNKLLKNYLPNAVPNRVNTIKRNVMSAPFFMKKALCCKVLIYFEKLGSN